jgi:ankyrin repeat protein
MVNLFLNHPNLFNRETHDGKTPLAIAAEYGNLKIVENLLKRSDRRQPDDKGIGALVRAAVFPRQDNVLLFLKNENLLAGHHTALHLACRQLHGHNMITHLIDPESIMYQDKQDGFSSLMVAVQHRQLGCVKDLLGHQNHTQEAFELTSPRSLRTVLHICAEVNDDKITEAIFERGHISDFLLKATDVMGNTALHVCAEVGNVYMTKRLLFHSTPVMPISKTSAYRTMTNLDSSGRVLLKSSPTTTTAAHEQGSIAKQVYVMLTKKNKSKLTPLHVAIHCGKSLVINEILQVANSSIIEENDDQRRTSLHMAAEKGKRE